MGGRGHRRGEEKTIMVMTKLMTAEELMVMPEDGWQYELIEGVLVRMPPDNPEHASLEVELVWHLRSFLEVNELGKLFAGDPGFILGRNPDTVLGPDIAFVGSNRLPAP